MAGKLASAPRAKRFELCEITHLGAVDTIVDRILAHRAEYEAIAAAVGVPWYVIAVIHYRESSLNFKTHLHNGDPLTRRTVHVPAGRPRTGTPPFTFVESAIDALQGEGMQNMGEVSIGKLLAFLEAYNGIGYQLNGMVSPYVWSFTDQYSAGKYVADGKLDRSFVDQQCGVAAILLRLHERGAITLRGEAVAVVVDNKTSTAQGFIIRGVSYVAVRDITVELNGVITDVDTEHGVVLVAKNGKAQGFKLSIIAGTGYVRARELVTWLGASISYDQGAQALEIASGKVVKK